MDNKYKRLGKNALVVFIGNMGSKLISIFMLPFYTSYLSPIDYGTSDIISTYSNILLAVITCCIADGILLFCKKADEKDKSVYFTSGVCFVLVSFVLFAFLCLGIEYLKLDIGILSKDIWWIFFMTVAMFIQSYVQQFTLSLDKIAVYSASGVVLTAALTILGLCLVPIYGIKGYLSSLIIAHILAAFFNIIFTKAFKFFNIYNLKKDYIKQLLCYCLPLIPNSMMWFLLNGINRPIMEATVGLEAIGIYAVANRFPGVIAMLCTVFSSAWGISMIEEFNSPQFNSFFNKTTRLLFFVMIFGGCFLVLLSKTIINIFASEDFFDAWKYLPVLTLAVIFQNMASLVGGVFMAEKKSIYFFYTSMIGAITSIVLTISLGRICGLMGVCVAVSVSFFLMLVSRVIFAWKHINEMNLTYYFLMILLFIILTICIITEVNKLFNIVTTVVVMAIMISINWSECKNILRLMRIKNKE